MKRFLFIIVFLASSIALFSQKISLDRGESLHKEINLVFNDIAVKGNEYVVFELNDDFDFDNLIFKVNGEILEDNTFKVYAKEINVKVALDVITKDDAKGGSSNFQIKVKETSNKLQDGVEYKGNDELYVEGISIPKTKKERITNYIIYLLIILVVLIITVIFYKRSRKFTMGHISYQEPYKDEISLRGRSKYVYVTLESRETVFELVKGKKGQPIIKDKIGGELDVNGELKSKNYQLKKEDIVSILRDGELVVRFVCY